MNTDLNANIAMCLKESNHLGFTRMHNVCNGAIHDVPWGSIDWTVAGLIGLLVAAMVVVFTGLIWAMVSTY